MLRATPEPFYLPDGTPAAYLRKFGFLPKKQRYIATAEPQYKITDHQFTDIVREYELQLKFVDKFGGTVATAANMSVNIAKLDCEPVTKFRKSPQYDATMEFVCNMDRPALTADTVDVLDVRSEINRSAVAGYPECLKYDNKGAAVDSDEFWDDYYDAKNDGTPFFTYSAKIEWKSLVDILENKIRGFASASSRLVIAQREFFGRISNNLKMFKWSFHGFSPFYGGTTKLVSYLGWTRRWIRWDTSGWDRKFPLMREVMSMYRRYLRIRAKDVDRFKRLFGTDAWYALSKFFYIMPDGSIVIMNFSNPSGNGLTTEINTSGHKFVFALFLLEHTKLSFAEIEALCIAMYGDDIVFGAPLEGEAGFEVINDLFPAEDPGRFYAPWLKDMFGWEPKFFVSDAAPHESAIVFLGFNPVPHHSLPGHYLPRWSRDRILTPFFRTYEKKSDAAIVSTMYSVLIMSYADLDLFRVLQQAYSQVLFSLKDSADPVIRGAILRGVPTNMQLDGLFTSLEGAPDSSFLREGLVLDEIFPHSNGWLEVEKKTEVLLPTVTLQAKMSNVKANKPKGKPAKLKLKAQQVQKAVQEAAAGGRKETPPKRAQDAGHGGQRGGAAPQKGEGRSGGVVRMGTGSGQGVRPNAAGSNSGASGVALKEPKFSAKTKPPRWVELKTQALVARMKGQAYEAHQRDEAAKAEIRNDICEAAGILPHQVKRWEDVTVHGETDNLTPKQRLVWESNHPSRMVREVTDPEIVAEAKKHSGIGSNDAARVSYFVHELPTVNPMSETHDVMQVTMHDGKAKALGVGDKFNHEGYETSGDELIQAVTVPPAIGGVTSIIPEGGILALSPANPRFIDGCRVTKLLEAYDQFRYHELTFGYEHVANAFTAGQLIMAFVNQFSDSIIIESGFQAARDLYARTGKAMFQVTQDRHCNIAHPLLKWYYTATQSDADLEMPGFVCVVTTQALSNADATPTPLGTLTMHYRIALRSPTIEGSTSQSFATSSASLSMTNAAGGNGAAIQVSVASCGLPSAQTQPGVVYWATIVATDDTTGVSWRSWADSASEDLHAMAPGNVLVWRNMKDGTGTPRLTFYPNLDAAIHADAYGVGPLWLGVAAMPAGVKGFKLWNVQGMNVEGSGE